jgi:hypothetical protein
VRTSASHAAALFLERGEALLSAHWPRALRGDFKAALTCMRVLDEQARFYGLIGARRAKDDILECLVSGC